MYGAMLFLHVLGATVWTGGHLILSVSIMPQALRTRDVGLLAQYERAYESVGLSALILQVATGLWLAHYHVPEITHWLNFMDPIARPVAAKLSMLALTAALALDARVRVLPGLSPARLTDLAWHVYPITAIAVSFVAVGVSFRTGWLY